MTISSTEAVPAGTPLALPAVWSPDSAEPIRAELYGLDSLEAQARELAAAARTAARDRAGSPMLRRLSANERVLVHVYQQIGAAARTGEPLTTDAEWLL